MCMQEKNDSDHKENVSTGFPHYDNPKELLSVLPLNKPVILSDSSAVLLESVLNLDASRNLSIQSLTTSPTLEFQPITQDSIAFQDPRLLSTLSTPPDSIQSFTSETGRSLLHSNPTNTINLASTSNFVHPEIFTRQDPTLASIVQPMESPLEAEAKERRENEEKIIEQQKQTAQEIEALKKIGLKETEIFRFNPQRLVRDNPTENSSFFKAYAEKIRQSGGWLNWHCASCSSYLKNAPNIRSIEDLRNCLSKFSKGEYFACERCTASNLFFIQDETIVFCGIFPLTTDPKKCLSGRKTVDENTVG